MEVQTGNVYLAAFVVILVFCCMITCVATARMRKQRQEIIELEAALEAAGGRRYGEGLSQEETEARANQIRVIEEQAQRIQDLEDVLIMRAELDRDEGQLHSQAPTEAGASSLQLPASGADQTDRDSGVLLNGTEDAHSTNSDRESARTGTGTATGTGNVAAASTAPRGGSTISVAETLASSIDSSLINSTMARQAAVEQATMEVLSARHLAAMETPPPYSRLPDSTSSTTLMVSDRDRYSRRRSAAPHHQHLQQQQLLRQQHGRPRSRSTSTTPQHVAPETFDHWSERGPSSLASSPVVVDDFHRGTVMEEYLEPNQNIPLMTFALGGTDTPTTVASSATTTPRTTTTAAPPAPTLPVSPGDLPPIYPDTPPSALSVSTPPAPTTAITTITAATPRSSSMEIHRGEYNTTSTSIANPIPDSSPIRIVLSSPPQSGTMFPSSHSVSPVSLPHSAPNHVPSSAQPPADEDLQRGTIDSDDVQDQGHHQEQG